MVVAIAVGKPGINMLLVASQVALSIVLPFVAFPLIWLTSSKSVMRVKKPQRQDEKPLQGVMSVISDEPELPTPVESSVSDDEALSVRRPSSGFSSR